MLCGWEYLNAVKEGKIKETSFVFMSAMDGAQLYQHKQSDCWIYIFILLEYEPSLRYMKKHVLIGGVIPGPNRPKNYDSFLFPGFYHIAALQNEGLRVWDISEDKIITLEPFYAFTSTDAIGSTVISGLVGHHGTFGCRFFCGSEG